MAQSSDDYVFKIRGNYTLACWGNVFSYSADDWRTIIDAMAKDDKNTIYFWLSGLFRSGKFPESFYYPQTRLSDDDVREIIDYCHEKGIKFYIGAGVFGWFGMDKIAESRPSTRSVETRGMCPSNEQARQINKDYLFEMLDRYPDADGFFLEMRDEYGPCFCKTCQKPLDEFGSKQYGEAEITWLREFTQELWKRKPEAEVSVAIGYTEKGSHTNDCNYYEGIRAMDDPRTSWLVVRGNYELPGAGGVMRPLGYFSKRMVHWMPYYGMALESMGEWMSNAHKAGAIGACPAFEPGFNSASFYGYDVPFPVDALPYRLTRFAFQQYCRDPQLSFSELKEAIRDEFLPGADERCLDDLLYLFRLIQTACGRREARIGRTWRAGWFREWAERAAIEAEDDGILSQVWEILDTALAYYDQIGDESSPILDEIEARLPGLDDAPAAAMMRRAVHDIRRELMIGPEYAEIKTAARRGIVQKLGYTGS